ncbi:Permease family protein [Paenibacillus sp. UNC496MF]|uniref:solute carrier family 23 protein n=1 Tax=Paenibacillus sp. UNC496MF TaxID=1502753 RepID=UPI0008EE89AA|nr:Permease family protein [Paenibacillus sp. UNC496MF]
MFAKGLYAVIFTFLLIILFDTTGTMLGVAEQAKLLQDGKFPRSQGARLADAVGTSAGALLGTSPTSAYIESSAGVAIGGRTGLTAVVVCALLAMTLFFSPVVSVLAGIPAITAPALVIVGFLMLDVLRRIEWSEPEHRSICKMPPLRRGLPARPLYARRPPYIIRPLYNRYPLSLPVSRMP